MSDRRSFLRSLIGLPLLSRLGAGRAGEATPEFARMTASLGKPLVGASPFYTRHRIESIISPFDVYPDIEQIPDVEITTMPHVVLNHDWPRDDAIPALFPSWKRFNPELGDGCLAGLDEYVNDPKEPS